MSLFKRCTKQELRQQRQHIKRNGTQAFIDKAYGVI